MSQLTEQAEYCNGRADGGEHRPDHPLDEPGFEGGKLCPQEVGRDVIAVLGSLADGGSQGVGVVAVNAGVSQPAGKRPENRTSAYHRGNCRRFLTSSDSKACRAIVSRTRLSAPLRTDPTSITTAWSTMMRNGGMMSPVSV